MKSIKLRADARRVASRWAAACSPRSDFPSNDVNDFINRLITQSIERVAGLEMKLARQNASNNFQVHVGPRCPYLFDHLRAVRFPIVIQVADKLLTELVAAPRLTPFRVAALSRLPGLEASVPVAHFMIFRKVSGSLESSGHLMPNLTLIACRSGSPPSRRRLLGLELLTVAAGALRDELPRFTSYANQYAFMREDWQRYGQKCKSVYFHNAFNG